MSIFRKSMLTGIAGAAAVAALVACGSGTNNDQGTSFLAIGFSEDGTEGSGDSGTIMPLSTDVSGLTVTLPNDVALAADGLMATTYIGLQNRMAQQFIRIERIECDYDVPGATIAIPHDAWATAAVIEGTGASVGPDLGNGEADPIAYSTEFVEFPVVSTNLYSFLNVNRNSLPELPFRLVATCYATGVTQSGAVLTTNPLNFTAEFVEVSECCTGATGESTGAAGGFQEGTGTGGDFDSFGEDTGAVTDGTATTEETVTE